MATGKRNDPHLVAFFKVEIEGMDGATFRSCQGLKSETEVYEHQEGGNNETVYKLVGPTRYNNLIFTQGFVSNPALFKWRDEIATVSGSAVKRRNGSVVAMAADGKTEVGRWNFEKAWPVRWQMGDWDSITSQAMVETLELAVERVAKGK